MARKSTKGRQKIKIEKISKKSKLMVTFSKRRTNLFKKAEEMSTLCGADVAIIVFSPSEKALSFGHPSVDTLINRYLLLPDSTNDSGTSSSQLKLVEEASEVNELKKALMETNEETEVEKKRGEELRKDRERKDRESENRYWWKKPVDELSLQELEQMKLALEKLERNVKKQSDEIVEAEEMVKELSYNVMTQPENTVVAAAGGNLVWGSTSSSMGNGGGFGHNSTAWNFC